jgi:hypothetical protein
MVRCHHRDVPTQMTPGRPPTVKRQKSTPRVTSTDEPAVSTTDAPDVDAAPPVDQPAVVRTRARTPRVQPQRSEQGSLASPPGSTPQRAPQRRVVESGPQRAHREAEDDFRSLLSGHIRDMRQRGVRDEVLGPFERELLRLGPARAGR